MQAGRPLPPCGFTGHIGGPLTPGTLTVLAGRNMADATALLPGIVKCALPDLVGAQAQAMISTTTGPRWRSAERRRRRHERGQ